MRWLSVAVVGLLCIFQAAEARSHLPRDIDRYAQYDRFQEDSYVDQLRDASYVDSDQYYDADSDLFYDADIDQSYDEDSDQFYDDDIDQSYEDDSDQSYDDDSEESYDDDSDQSYDDDSDQSYDEDSEEYYDDQFSGDDYDGSDDDEDNSDYYDEERDYRDWLEEKNAYLRGGYPRQRVRYAPRQLPLKYQVYGQPYNPPRSAFKAQKTIDDMELKVYEMQNEIDDLRGMLSNKQLAYGRRNRH